MSRGVAVVLFTDVVGSTELRGRLGEDAAEELRRRHDRLLTGAVEGHYGRVVKGLGDGIMATFAGAADGVEAAVAIQQAIDRLNRSGEAPVPLVVRVGLSAGDVTFEDDDVHGTPVIEASRLSGAAAGGEILAAEVVQVLAGATAHHRCIGIGPLTLKGLDHPVAAVRIEWEPAVVSPIPMPALLTDIGRIFVGRGAELERLTQLWKEAAAGDRRVALLAGEPGVGKTRLAAEVAARVHEEGGVVLAGRCDEDLGVPYQPFTEALRHFTAHTPATDLTERLGQYGGELRRLVPELGGQAPGLARPLRSDPETERYRLFDGVAGWLAAASADAPILLVLDDLHWAAKPTLLLLRHVLRSSEPLRLLVVATYRDTELGRRHPLADLLADLRRATGVDRLLLPGLDSVAVTRLVEQAAGHPLDVEDQAFAHAVYAETEGNPFFVGEVLRHLAETGAIQRSRGRWVTTTAIDELGIPEGIRDVVGRRLSRLSDEANDVLATAAVIGADFELSVIQRACGLPEDTVAATLDEALAARLVTEVPSAFARYRFAHALVRGTLYDELTAARRVVLHRKVAEAIEALHPLVADEDLPALAYHYGRAAVPATEPAKAVDYARRAGDAALGQLAHDDAVRYYQHALDLLDLSEVAADDPRRPDLLIALGEAQRRAGIPAHRETLLRAAGLAEARGDGDALARAALANTRGAWSVSGGVDTERVAALRAALGALRDDAVGMRARLLANLAAETTFEGDEDACQQLLDEALALARRAGEPAIVANVLVVRYRALSGPGAITQRAAESSDLLVLAESLDDPVAICWALMLRGRSALEWGERADADRCFERSAQLVREAGQPTLRWFDAFYRTGLAVASGWMDESERLRQTVLELGTATGMPETTASYGALLALQRLGDGDPTEGEPFLRQGIVDLPGLDFVPALLAFLAAETGRLDDARAALAAARARGFARPPRNHFYVATLVCWSAVAARVNDVGSARALLELLRPFPEHTVAPATMVLGSLAHSRGLLAATIGDFDDAMSHFAVAEAHHARLRFPVWLCRTRLEWARALLIRRRPADVEQAQELVGQALDSARELGLGNVERQAVALRR